RAEGTPKEPKRTIATFAKSQRPCGMHKLNWQCSSEKNQEKKCPLHLIMQKAESADPSGKHAARQDIRTRQYNRIKKLPDPRPGSFLLPTPSEGSIEFNSRI